MEEKNKNEKIQYEKSFNQNDCSLEDQIEQKSWFEDFDFIQRGNQERRQLLMQKFGGQKSDAVLISDTLRHFRNISYKKQIKNLVDLSKLGNKSFAQIGQEEVQSNSQHDSNQQSKFKELERLDTFQNVLKSQKKTNKKIQSMQSLSCLYMRSAQQKKKKSKYKLISDQNIDEFIKDEKLKKRQYFLYKQQHIDKIKSALKNQQNDYVLNQLEKILEENINLKLQNQKLKKQNKKNQNLQKKKTKIQLNFKEQPKNLLSLKKQNSFATSKQQKFKKIFNIQLKKNLNKKQKVLRDQYQNFKNMQNTIKNYSNRVAPIENGLKLLERLRNQFGEVTLLRNPTTEQIYMMKEKRFKNKEEFFMHIQKAQMRHEFKHPNLMSYVDFSTIMHEDSGLQRYVLRQYYNYVKNCCVSEIKKRKKNLHSFSIEEITYLFYDMIEACAYLESKNVQHGEIGPQMILVQKNGKFILGDRLKNRERFPQNMINKYLRGDSLFMAPEIFKGIEDRDSSFLSSANIYKADVFCLGLSFLTIGIQKDPTNIYQKRSRKINEQTLQGYLSQFKEKYRQNGLVVKVLQNMLQIDPSLRPSFMDLKYSLPPIDLIKNYFAKQPKSQPVMLNNNGNTMRQTQPVNMDSLLNQTNVQGSVQNMRDSIFDPIQQNTMIRNSNFLDIQSTKNILNNFDKNDQITNKNRVSNSPMRMPIDIKYKTGQMNHYQSAQNFKKKNKVFVEQNITGSQQQQNQIQSQKKNPPRKNMPPLKNKNIPPNPMKHKNSVQQNPLNFIHSNYKPQSRSTIGNQISTTAFKKKTTYQQEQFQNQQRPNRFNSIQRTTNQKSQIQRSYSKNLGQNFPSQPKQQNEYYNHNHTVRQSNFMQNYESSKHINRLPSKTIQSSKFIQSPQQQQPPQRKQTNRAQRTNSQSNFQIFDT